MKRPLIAAAVVAATASLSVSAAGLPPGFDDNPSVPDAVAKAQASGKPVIVYYTERNCASCNALDGWLVRGDIRQAYKDSYHFSLVFGDDMVPEERDRWRATYSPRGAPAWVVLTGDGRYLCTASGGFANANAALELHKLLSRAVAKAEESGGTGDAPKLAAAPVKPRSCSAAALGLSAESLAASR